MSSSSADGARFKSPIGSSTMRLQLARRMCCLQDARQLFYAAGNVYTYNAENVTESSPFGSSNAVRPVSVVSAVQSPSARLLSTAPADQAHVRHHMLHPHMPA